MQERKETTDTRYTVNRVFLSNNTAASLIEQRILKEKSQQLPLTKRTGVMYNETNGSIPSKEGL